MATDQEFEGRTEFLFANFENPLRSEIAGYVQELEPMDDAIIESNLVSDYDELYNSVGREASFLSFD